MNETQDFKQGTVAESAKSQSVESYGKIIVLSRQPLINDDVGAF